MIGIGGLITGAIDDFFHPLRLRLLALDPDRGVYDAIGADQDDVQVTMRSDSDARAHQWHISDRG